ncbi:MAG: dihydropyrimidinase, partial [Spartobacteria bacterium]|nr:dihydropyrimidinase [Spartobacteria bacterium]
MSLLIRNGEVITSNARYRADIYCEDETITRIGLNLDAPPGTVIVDATNQYVFPGFIDPHVHIHLPLADCEAQDTYESAGRAALRGGTTCFIDFVSPNRDEEPLATLEEWNRKSHGHCPCDFTYHMAVTRFDDLEAQQLKEIVDLGITSFKVYLAYKKTIGVDDYALFHTLKLAKELGALVVAHCENATIIDEMQRLLIAQGKSEPKWHYWSRPPLVEAEGVHHLLSFATLHNVPVYIVHTTCYESLKEAIRARRRGLQLWVETCIQYLLLDHSLLENADFDTAAKYILSPPLRDKRNHRMLWKALRDFEVNTVATDHCPIDLAVRRELGLYDFTKIPNGLPGIEDRVNLLFTYGVMQGRISLERFVDVASTQAAKIFGL